MIVDIPAFVLNIANYIARIPGLKRVLKPFYYPIKERILKNKNTLFKQNGIEVLRLFDQTMRSNGIPYTVFAGTLLGAVRNKGFIEHDLDIDTAIFYEDYSERLTNVLEEVGFKRTRVFKIQDGMKGMEETYNKDGVSLDIFYIYSDETFPTYQCDFHPYGECPTCESSMKKYGFVEARRLEFPVKYNFIRLPFENITVSAISNYEEWLRYRYGADYMIPNPAFRDNGQNPNIFNWTSEKALYISK